MTGTTTLTVSRRRAHVDRGHAGNPSIAKGLTQQFTATGTFYRRLDGNLTGSVTWTSSNLAVATISRSGLASTLGPGSSTITAADGIVAVPRR